MESTPKPTIDLSEFPSDPTDEAAHAEAPAPSTEGAGAAEANSPSTAETGAASASEQPLAQDAVEQAHVEAAVPSAEPTVPEPRPSAPKPSELKDLFLGLGSALDENAASLSAQVEEIRDVVHASMIDIGRAISRENALEAELRQARSSNAQLLAQISELQAVKSEYDALVPQEFGVLLDSLEAERKPLAFATLHLLAKLAKTSGTSPQLLAELSQSLGLAIHLSPQPSVEALDKSAEALNQLFKKGESQMSVRRARSGDAIDPSFMDGAELQGKRIVADVKTWAVLAAEKVVRKAQITGK